MYGLYISTLSGLRDTTRVVHHLPLDPLVPLTMILSTLFFMLFLSASVSALNSLFMAKDLDLLLSSPISWNRYLLGRTCDVGFASSWMLVVFGAPLLFAFGSFYGAGLNFFIGAPIVCLIFFSIAIIAGVIAALLFGWLIPPQRGREIALALFVIVIVGTYLSIGRASNASLVTTPQRLNELSTWVREPWIPTGYCARALYQLLQGAIGPALLASSVHVSVVGILWLLALTISTLCYQRAYSRAQSDRPLMRINSRAAQRISRAVFPLIEPPRRALITKEIKLFSRDLSHTIQLGLLLGICFVYLYNFQVLTGPEDASPTVLRWWHAFLMVCNMCLSYLIMTSICSRFVFPSVSLEGPAFWILQSSPISLDEMLRAKCKSWFVPVSIMGSVIFMSGAMALRAEGPLLLATCIASVILCYGLVHLAVGIGAIFSQFDWEYSSQVSTNVGSFVFMVVSVIFLALNMIPIGMMFGAYIIMPGTAEDPTQVVWTLGLSLTALFLLNRIVAHWALSAGVKALEPK
jgi:ABC-2 type transport system permease protein